MSKQAWAALTSVGAARSYLCFRIGPLLAERMAIGNEGRRQRKTETRRIARSVVGVQIRDDKMPELESQYSIVGFNPNSAIDWIWDLG